MSIIAFFLMNRSYTCTIIFGLVKIWLSNQSCVSESISRMVFQTHEFIKIVEMSKNVALFFCQSTGGLLSLLASLTLLTKLCKSRRNPGRDTPSTRLLIGLTCCDVLTSTVHFLASIPVPSQTPHVWGAIGNETTCTIQGVLYLLGAIPCPFYNLALCIYYLCVIRYSMADDTFAQRFEPTLHIVPLIWGVGSAITVASMGYIAPGVDRPVCFIGYYDETPFDTEDESMVTILFGVLILIPLLLIVAGILCIMTFIFYIVWKQNRWMDQYRFSSFSPRNTNRTRSRGASTPSSSRNTESCGDGAGTGRRSRIFRRNSHQINRRVQAAKTKAILYFIVFGIVYIPLFIWKSGVWNDFVPFACLAWFLFPLQGVMNCMIHLHPQVQSIRRRMELEGTTAGNPCFLWIRAYWKALITFDEQVDGSSTRSSGRSRTSLGIRPGRGVSLMRLFPRMNSSKPESTKAKEEAMEDEHPYPECEREKVNTTGHFSCDAELQRANSPCIPSEKDGMNNETNKDEGENTF